MGALPTATKWTFTLLLAAVPLADFGVGVAMAMLVRGESSDSFKLLRLSYPMISANLMHTYGTSRTVAVFCGFNHMIH